MDTLRPDLIRDVVLWFVERKIFYPIAMLCIVLGMGAFSFAWQTLKDYSRTRREGSSAVASGTAHLSDIYWVVEEIPLSWSDRRASQVRLEFELTADSPEEAAVRRVFTTRTMSSAEPWWKAAEPIKGLLDFPKIEFLFPSHPGAPDNRLRELFDRPLDLLALQWAYARPETTVKTVFAQGQQAAFYPDGYFGARSPGRGGMFVGIFLSLWGAAFLYGGLALYWVGSMIGAAPDPRLTQGVMWRVYLSEALILLTVPLWQPVFGGIAGFLTGSRAAPGVDLFSSLEEPKVRLIPAKTVNGFERVAIGPGSSPDDNVLGLFVFDRRGLFFDDLKSARRAISQDITDQLRRMHGGPVRQAFVGLAEDLEKKHTSLAWFFAEAVEMIGTDASRPQAVRLSAIHAVRGILSALLVERKELALDRLAQVAYGRYQDSVGPEKAAWASSLLFLEKSEFTADIRSPDTARVKRAFHAWVDSDIASGELVPYLPLAQKWSREGDPELRGLADQILKWYPDDLISQ